MKYVQRFPDEVNISIVKTIEMDTVDFDSFAKEKRINNVDFMKLDTEGSELDILKGAIEFLKKTVIGLIIEVEFSQFRKEQPVFSEVDSFMRELGFGLFNLETYRLARKSLKPTLDINESGVADFGQIIWGEALYLRDGVNEIDTSSSLEDGWDDIRVLKLASLMELFCLPDCAIELIQVAYRKGLLQGWDVAHLVDLLVPGGGESVSYSEYLRKIEQKGRVSAIIGSGKQFITKFVPWPIRRSVRRYLIMLRDLIDEIVS